MACSHKKHVTLLEYEVPSLKHMIDLKTKVSIVYCPSCRRVRRTGNNIYVSDVGRWYSVTYIGNFIKLVDPRYIR